MSGSPRPPATIVVDFHVHVFPPEVARRREEIAASDEAFRSLYADPRSRLATVEHALAAMDVAGVDRAVLVGFGWSDAGRCRDHNDYLVQAVRQHPDRLSALAAIQPRDRSAAAEVERVAELGLAGIGELMPHLQGYELDDPSVMSAVAGAAEARGLILLTHSSEPVGHSYPGKGDVSPRALLALAERHPNLRIVAAHFGGGLPFYALMPEVAQAICNVYFDSSAATYLYRPEVFRIVADLVGADRVLFGSDYPLLRPGPLIRRVRALGMPEHALSAILGGNALDLLQLR